MTGAGASDGSPQLIHVFGVHRGVKLVRAFQAVVLFLAVLAPRQGLPQGATDAARVQADVRAIIDAIYEGDVDTILRLSHPATLQAMGGTAEARRALEGVTRQLRALGMRQESFAFPDDPRFVRGNKRLFAVVPTRAVIVTQGKRVESWNFQLGIRADGSTRWTYFEGSRLSDDARKQFFPDFPTELRLPRVSRDAR